MAQEEQSDKMTPPHITSGEFTLRSPWWPPRWSTILLIIGFIIGALLLDVSAYTGTDNSSTVQPGVQDEKADTIMPGEYSNPLQPDTRTTEPETTTTTSPDTTQ